MNRGSKVSEMRHDMLREIGANIGIVAEKGTFRVIKRNGKYIQIHYNPNEKVNYFALDENEYFKFSPTNEIQGWGRMGRAPKDGIFDTVIIPTSQSPSYCGQREGPKSDFKRSWKAKAIDAELGTSNKSMRIIIEIANDASERQNEDAEEDEEDWRVSGELEKSESETIEDPLLRSYDITEASEKTFEEGNEKQEVGNKDESCEGSVSNTYKRRILASDSQEYMRVKKRRKFIGSMKTKLKIKNEDMPDPHCRRCDLTIPQKRILRIMEQEDLPITRKASFRGEDRKLQQIYESMYEPIPIKTVTKIRHRLAQLGYLLPLNLKALKVAIEMYDLKELWDSDDERSLWNARVNEYRKRRNWYRFENEILDNQNSSYCITSQTFWIRCPGESHSITISMLRKCLIEGDREKAIWNEIQSRQGNMVDALKNEPFKIQVGTKSERIDYCEKWCSNVIYREECAVKLFNN